MSIYNLQLKEFELALNVMGASICSKDVREITKANLNNYEQEIMLRSGLLQMNEQIETTERDIECIKNRTNMIKHSTSISDTGKSDYLSKKQAELSNLKNKMLTITQKYQVLEVDFRYFSD